MTNFEIIEMTPGRIKTNFDIVKAELEKELDKYKGITVTEESLPICKDIKRDLKRWDKNIDNFRKHLKKELMEPAEVFNESCRELQKMIFSVVDPIDQGIKEYDNKLRDEKIERAKEYVAETCEKMGFKEVDKIEILYSWGNTTKTKKAIIEEIVQQIEGIRARERDVERRKETFQTLIDIENESLTTKININDFSKLIEETDDDAVVIKAIKEQARTIHKVEESLGKESEPVEAEHGYLIRIFDDKATAMEVIRILSENGFFARVE